MDNNYEVSFPLESLVIGGEQDVGNMQKSRAGRC